MIDLVSASGGTGSWATANRVKVLRGSSESIRLVFSDTLIEDGDLYRFLVASSADIFDVDLPAGWDASPSREDCLALARAHLPGLTWLIEGRDVWQVFHDKRYLGNSRIDPCSRILKRELIRGWIEATYAPEDVVVHLGIDWTESHRFERAEPQWAPYRVTAPLCAAPYLEKADIHADLERRGIAVPRLYAMGFPHNNCGGFCVKAGQGAFKLLLEQLPARYAEHERREEELRAYLGKDVAIMKDRRGGGMRPLTMREFRERLEAEAIEVDELDLGGCGCMTPNAYDQEPVA